MGMEAISRAPMTPHRLAASLIILNRPLAFNWQLPFTNGGDDGAILEDGGEQAIQ